jgi:two-component system response regulator
MSHPAILLVEDSDDDADLTARAFKEAKIANPIIRALDGVEALDYLRSAEVLPAVVLLDLKLPRLGGLEVLGQLRANPRTRLLPVVVLTSSDEDQDRLAAYAHHANSYVRKPVDYDQFVGAARQLGLYWTVVNIGPPP